MYKFRGIATKQIYATGKPYEINDQIRRQMKARSLVQHALMTCAACVGLWSSAAIAEDLTWGQAMHEQVIMIPNLSGSSQLETTIFRPDGKGPFPVAIINHGKQAGNPARQPRDRSPVVAREFLERGYAVILPMREGFSHSGGVYAIPGCNVEFNGKFEAFDIQAAVAFVQQQSWADHDKIVIIGQSHGGLSTMAYGAHNPAHVRALINFAGGLNYEGTNCRWQDSLVHAFETYGKTTTIPSVWFYGANDSLFGPELARRMFDAYTKTHLANVRLVAFGPFGTDAHNLSGSIAGIPIWWPETAALLQRVGMPTKRMFVATNEGELPVTEIVDGQAPPGLNQLEQAAYEGFLKTRLPRAAAHSVSGIWSTTSGGPDFIERALQNCRERSTLPCSLYLVNHSVVQGGPSVH
jgi:dienelactone hydrolase